MQQADYDDFFAMMEATAQMYGKEISPATVEIWFRALQAYDLTAVRAGLNRHVQNPDTGQFMPKPADVVRMLAGTTQDGAMAAWAKADRALRGIGPYQSVVFDDPVIHTVIADMGGWVAIGNKTERDWPFVAREFENRYRAYRTAGQLDAYPPVLVGIAQAQNESQDLPVSDPVLIGDREQAVKTRLFGREAHAVPWHRPGQSLPAPMQETASTAASPNLAFLNS